jgi:hypothetical protein
MISLSAATKVKTARWKPFKGFTAGRAEERTWKDIFEIITPVKD